MMWNIVLLSVLAAVVTAIGPLCDPTIKTILGPNCSCELPCQNDVSCNPAVVLCFLDMPVSLHLSGRDLSELPENIGDLNASMMTMDLSFNKLKRLPTSFGVLNNVMTLALSSNNLSSWQELQNIHMFALNLHSNAFSDWPGNWSQFKESMSSLDLSSNSLSSIDPRVETLTFLVSLNLGRNNISDISTVDWSKLRQLSDLNLADNPVKSLPDSIASSSVHFLNLMNARLGDLPPSFKSLTSLVLLSIGGNRLNGVLNNLPRASSMNFLNLEDLSISELPPVVLEMAGLKELYLGKNELDQESDLSNLTSLVFLSLEDNKLSDIPILPRSITSLSLKGNQLRGTLPSKICDYTRLKKLDVSRNKLTALPDCIEKLADLRSLILTGNELRKLDVLKPLENLVDLPLDDNLLICDDVIRQLSRPGWNVSCQQDFQVQRKTLPSWAAALIFGAIGLVVVVVISFTSVVIYFRTRQRRLAKRIKELEGVESLITPLLPEELRGLKEFAADDPALGVTVSPHTLTFGSASMQLPLDQDLQDTLTVTGSRRTKTNFHVEFPNFPDHKGRIEAQYPKNVVECGESVAVTVKLRVLCTTTFSVPVAVITDEGYTSLRLQAESQLSTRIDADEVATSTILGAGSFGTVYRGEWRGVDVAVKVYSTNVLADIGLSQDIERETEMCFKLRSPYVVTFFGRTVEREGVKIIMEFVPHGSLGSLITKGPLQMRYKVRVALDVARGMNYLHQNRIIHRDLKSDNVLVTSLEPDGVVVAKLSDFNTSRFWGSEAMKTKTKGVGTPVFMAPEVLDGKKYASSADVFSFGVLLYNLWTQIEPYREFQSSLELFRFVMEGKRLSLPEDLPAPLAKITGDSWQHAPEARPTFQNLVRELSDFFQAMVH